MPFKLIEFVEQFRIGTFLITLNQLEKTGSIGKGFIPLEIKKLNSTFDTRNRSRFLAPFFHDRIWRSAYIPMCIDK